MNQLAYDTKATLKAELKFIPAVAWAVAGVVLLLWFAVAMPLILGTVKPRPGEPPMWVLGVILAFAGIILGIWVLMVFYVNADAGRRQMNRLLWTLIVIFVPNAIGFIVYFLLRRPIAGLCLKCRALVQPDFIYCPACGQALALSCPSCHRSVESGWSNCAYCGVQLSS